MQISIINRAAEDRFMYGVKQSIRAHCIILLSQVILSQVGSLFFLCFILYEETGDRSTPRMSLKVGENFRQTGLVTVISVVLFTIQYTEKIINYGVYGFTVYTSLGAHVTSLDQN